MPAKTLAKFTAAKAHVLMARKMQYPTALFDTQGSGNVNFAIALPTLSTVEDLYMQMWNPEDGHWR